MTFIDTAILIAVSLFLYHRKFAPSYGVTSAVEI